MKRRALSALAALAMLFGTVVLAGNTPSGAAIGERASGRGIDNVGNKFSFRARGGTGLTEATGVFKIEHPSGATTSGEITCMNVGAPFSDSRLAAIGGTVTKASNPAVVGLETMMAVRDFNSADADGFLHIGYFDDPNPCASGFINPDTIAKGRIALVDDGA